MRASKLKKGEDVSAVGHRIRHDLVDAMMDLYCDWRTECAEVRAAYGRFSSAQPSERAVAFAAYAAALDREEAACGAYAAQIRLITLRFAADTSGPRASPRGQLPVVVARVGPNSRCRG
jgi:hypothetical protein